MAGLFEIPNRSNRTQDSAIVKKANSKARKAPTTVKGGGGLMDRISTIKAMVETNLGYLKDEYLVLRDFDSLNNYIDIAIRNGIISIDTETDGLDPILNHIAGLCLYTPGEKAAYVPMNHISYITNMPTPDQVSNSEAKVALQKLVDNETFIVMFNAKFDMRVIRNQIGVYLKCDWDCYLAARLLNENEGSGNNGLKKLHNKYVLNGEGDSFRFDDLFNGIEFTKIPINTGYLYAAHDAIITYELYQYQLPYLSADNEKCISRGLQDIAWVFHNIEMPCVEVVCDMEDVGVEFDLEYNATLQEKYHKLLEEKRDRFYELCGMYDKEIAGYKAKNPNHKLSEPINISSATQLAILLYDIIGEKSVDDKKPRGTGEDILQKINTPLCQSILDYRGIEKLINTYIDKLPSCVNEKDGRIHCSFNQYGADTGRMSSSEPNLQNIPSHNKDIRKTFKATDGYVLMSSDFSQQEPKCLAALCAKAGDEQMLNTFLQGKDLYSEIASKAFNVPYDECREFRPDGTTNKDGKERRSQAKSILLGVLYGRGEASIAEQLGCSTKKAKDIKESVFKGFPAIKQFEQNSLDMAKDVGYVTTVCGRKRRLPDLQLPEYEFKWKDGVAPDDDLLDFDSDAEPSTEVPYDIEEYYLRKLSRAQFGQKRKIFEEANDEGIWIIDNGKKIADATRQCVNARIQGSAADLTKLAMIRLQQSDRLKELGFRILIPVHDEIIAECPKESMKECSELLAKTMSEAAEDILKMPISCDVEITERWYGESVKI